MGSFTASHNKRIKSSRGRTHGRAKLSLRARARLRIPPQCPAASSGRSFGRGGVRGSGFVGRWIAALKRGRAGRARQKQREDGGALNFHERARRYPYYRRNNSFS
jgi:hypothetical protein